MSDFIPAHQPADDSVEHHYVHVIGGAVWTAGEADEALSRHFVGMHGRRAVWAVDVPDGHDPSDGAAIDLYALYGRSGDDVEWLIAGRAVQLVEWARTHRFCGRCGTPTAPQRSERAMKCPACGLLAFPRLAPAMITLVTRGDGTDEQALLARGVQFRGPFFSCLAGFVEPGETLEGAVAREVREEVGIEIADVRYQSSQPWPFPHSLMVGFRARWASGDLRPDPAEIVAVGWFGRDELLDGSGPQLPGRISIARKLIDGWLHEQRPPG